jgi:AraC-like DNA-binding protein
MGRYLDAFTIVKTRRVGEMRSILVDVYHARSFHLLGDRRLFSAEVAYCNLGSSKLSYSAFSVETLSEFRDHDYFRFQFCISGFGQTTAEEHTVDVDPATVVCTPANAVVTHGPSFEQLVLRIDEGMLEQDLTNLLGAPAKERISFEMSADSSAGHVRRLRENVVSAASTIDISNLPIPAPLLRELDQMLRIMTLYSMPNNFSDRLNAGPPLSAPWQVKCIEEWIDSHWRESVTIDTLVEISGASLRSIFATFKKARGYTPMAYLKKVRLSGAREMLLNAEPNASVIGIGLACNFMSTSHFAREYKRQFGELPSETLRHGKRLMP